MSKIKNNKIAVVGCGPSGIFTCYFLNKLGYTNIHLYGDINDAQPKTIMVDDIVNDIATCYIHNGYNNSIVKLLNEFNLQCYDIGGENYIQRIINNKITEIDNVNISLDELHNLILFIYLCIKWKLFNTTSHEYSKNMEDYLKNNGVNTSSKLIKFITMYGTNAQGYGYINDVTSYHLFRWLRISILFTNKLGINSKRMITGGFSNLFRTIFNNLQLKRKINKNVIECDKNFLTYDKKTKYYDNIFICCPLVNLKTPLHKKINNIKHITYSKFFSFTFETTLKIKELRHRLYIDDNILKNKKSKILTIRYNNKTPYGVNSNCGRHIYVCVGYCETFNENKEKTIIQKELKKYGFDIKKDIYFQIYKYNYRFTTNAIQEGLHLYVNKQQGNDGLYYLGGMLSHWDVDSIYEHSREIVNNFHLNNTNNIIDKIQTFVNIQYNKWIDEW